MSVRPSWKSDYESGIAEVDAAHKNILLQCGMLIEAAEHGQEHFQQVLEVLFSMVLDHFHDEERLMGAVLGTVHAEQHSQDHKLIIKLLADGEAYEASRCTTYDMRLRLARMIEEWMLREISTADYWILRTLQPAVEPERAEG